MNTGRRVDSNIWHLPRKWGCTWTSTKFQPLWCSVKEPLSLTMLKKQEKNDVGDDDMDLYRLNWSTSALAVIGVHCNPASRRPPMHFLLHKALESSAILCTVPQIHLYFPMHSKKAFHRTWAWGWGQSYNWLDCSPRCMKDIFLPPSSQLFDTIRHDMIELRFFGSSFFRLHEYYAKHSSWQILHAPLAGTSLWENLSRYKMSITHSYQNCSWFIVTTSRQ